MTKLSGDWNSYYRYPSTGRGDDFWGQHVLHATQTGDKLKLETSVDSPSHVVMELELDDETNAAIGTWVEDADPKGYYQGKRYDGTIKLRIAENGERMNGIWHGAGKDGTMNSDIWELAKAKESMLKDDMPKRWKLTHWYPSSHDDGEGSDEHEMKAHWNGDMVVMESVPKDSGSYILTRLLIQDRVAAGSWYEETSLLGKSKGAQYSGAGQLTIDPENYRMEGMWAGAGYDHALKKIRIYTGRWEIVPIAE
jgi:hypothetical protein